MTDHETRPTYTEEWRRECEARLVLSWPLARRRAYIADIERIRGPKAAETLRADIEAQWRARKSSADNASY